MRDDELPHIGWREWVGLPGFDVGAVKAKIDTGARSSSLHAFGVELFERDGTPYVRFTVHPFQRSVEGEVTTVAELIDMRNIRNSGGKVELRPVIETEVTLGLHRWSIELTLTSRDEMGFRMLLGRQAVRGRFLVDAGRSYLLGKKPAGLRGRRKLA
jgi:hypothetical protein